MQITGRLIGAAILGAVAGGWIGRAIFRWLLDIDKGTETALIVVSAVVGLAIGFALGVATQREEAAKQQR